MTSSKLTILRGETLVENRCAFVGDSVFPSFEPFSIGSDCAAILDAVTLQLHVRNEQVNLSVVELQHRLSVSFFLNSQLLAFSFFFFFFILFCARNFIVLSLHAPRTDRRDVREGTKIARAAIRSTLPRSRDTSKTIRRNWETFLPEERRQNECN